eukprot:scaffold31822_cov26-Tisochrysis_lutea.AAC.2
MNCKEKELEGRRRHPSACTLKGCKGYFKGYAAVFNPPPRICISEEERTRKAFTSWNGPPRGTAPALAIAPKAQSEPPAHALRGAQARGPIHSQGPRCPRPGPGPGPSCRVERCRRALSHSVASGTGG